MVVSTTYPDQAQAFQACQQLVGAGLAACGQVGSPLQSCYRWEGALHQDQEFPVTFKVLTDRLKAFVAELKSLHPYEIPQITAWPAVYVDPDYLAWARGGAE